jgi:hypothetical protein
MIENSIVTGSREPIGQLLRIRLIEERLLAEFQPEWCRGLK